MTAIDLKDAVAAHFADEQNLVLSRAWSAFTETSIAIKRQKIRVLTLEQLIRDIDRDIVIFETTLTDPSFTGQLWWIFDRQQILHVLNQLMKQDGELPYQSFTELSSEEQAALMGLAQQGGKTLIRNLRNQDQLNLNYKDAQVRFYTQESLVQLETRTTEGLCRVVESGFDVFGAPVSMMLTLFPMSLIEYLYAQYSHSHSPEILRQWHPASDTKIRILIADGSEVTRRSIQKSLQGFLVDVDIAHHGEEAMDIVKKQSVDLIFCDLNMPRVNGIHFTRWLRSQEHVKKTPLIICGQMPQKGVLLEAVRAGMNEFIVKPPEAKKIKKLVTQYLPEAVV